MHSLQVPGFEANQPIFIFGSSLGGGVTTHLCHALARERQLGKTDAPEIRLVAVVGLLPAHSFFSIHDTALFCDGTS